MLQLSMRLRIWDSKLVSRVVVDLKINLSFGGFVVTAVILFDLGLPISRIYIYQPERLICAKFSSRIGGFHDL